MVALCLDGDFVAVSKIRQARWVLFKRLAGAKINALDQDGTMAEDGEFDLASGYFWRKYVMHLGVMLRGIGL